ncbi:MAG: MBL fold metallo-hydrolase [Rhodospirillaceae bacterium]|nr:MBL fold metallo-hydrolase [Rhodospirillaceae bacterium]
MDITLLGTGCPIANPDRYGAGNLIRAGEQTFLVDVGSGVTQRLLEAGANSAEIDALFITHMHSDHLVDLYQLLMSSFHQSRDVPHRIFGPPGIRKFTDGLMELWREEREMRIKHEKRASNAAFDLEVTEFEEGVIWDTGGVRVSAVRVEHAPIRHAFGFVFESGGQKVAFSGDTKYCDALIDAAQGADALIHEVFVHVDSMPLVGARTAAGRASVASYHTVSDQVGKVAAESKAKCLILNHFVPPSFDRDFLLDTVRADYAGPIIIGEDLMCFDIAKRRLTHRNGVIGY